MGEVPYVVHKWSEVNTVYCKRLTSDALQGGEVKPTSRISWSVGRREVECGMDVSGRPGPDHH